jgi:nucleoside-diphosphate-sugar epimerase
MLSTRRVYGKLNQFAASENTFLGPDTIYGVNKLNAENIVKKYSHDFLILRLPNVYGFEYFEKRNSFFKIMLTSIKKDNKIFIDTSLNTRRDFFFIEDFVRVVGLLLKNNINGIFNISYGQPVFLRNIFNYFLDLNPNIVVNVTDHLIYDEFFLINKNLSKHINININLIGIEKSIFSIYKKLEESNG